MAGEKTKISDIKKPSEDDQRRQRSTIAFPYMDLGAAIEIANAIHKNTGNGNCSIDQIAAWTDQSAKSSGLRIQLGTTRSFGLIDSDGPENYRLSQLGRRIIDPSQARKAKVEAFMKIPLYQAVFNKYKGGVLPPTAALERDIESLGVSGKQKDRARLALEKSAEVAGFFEHGKNRLVEPAIKDDEVKFKEENDDNGEDNNYHNGSGGNKKILHPLIKGLVDALPEAGKDWTAKDRIDWLTAAVSNFKLIYKGGKGDITISCKQESQSDGIKNV